MIPIPPLALKYGAYALVLGATYVGGCVRGSQTANEKYLQFKADVEAVGKAKQYEAEIEKAKGAQRAEASDASYAKALTVVGNDLERLRKRVSSGAHDLPAPAPSATCPQGQRCFDREQFDAALRDYEGEVLTLVGEGATLKLRLDTAIRWANP